jgi:hypothetical protein
MKYSALVLLGFSLTACASIVSGTSEPLSVETRSLSDGTQLVGATCTMTNDKGTWFVQTPGSVTVHRSLADMAIQCSKDGFQPAINTTLSTTKGMAFGNLLFGGLIGTAVDVGSGAAYDYPTLISIMMTPTPSRPTANANNPTLATVGWRK